MSSLTAMTQQLLALSARHPPSSSRFRERALQQLVSVLPLTQTIGIQRGTTFVHRRRERSGIAAQINSLARKLLHIVRALSGDREEEFDLTAELYHLKSAYDDFGHARITLCLQSAALEILTREEERDILCLVRESVRHRIRHAHATHVSVSLRRNGQRIRLHIVDNGVDIATGITHSQIRDAIRSLEHRARSLRGTMRVETMNGNRARITVEFFLEPTLISL
ncbi:MAG: hypothetical protein NNA20_03375 [Nitrospira sp.]|nr:hypothetical protein [Nitrospira sp.]